MNQNLAKLETGAEEPSTLSIHPTILHSVHDIAALLGCDPEQIISEALEDWINSVAPVRLEALLNSQNENSATRTVSATLNQSAVQAINDGSAGGK